MALPPEKKKALQRVLKLLAMTVENGCTEFEAESARQQAEKIMQKEGLSETDLNNLDFTISEWYIEAPDGSTYRTIPTWSKLLNFKVYNLFGVLCVLTMDREGNQKISITGRESDIEIAGYCIEVIEEQCHNLRDEYIKKHNIRKNSSYSVAFMNGLVSGVIDNLEKMLHNMVPVGKSAGKQLTVLNQNLVRVEEAKLFHEKETGKSLQAFNLKGKVSAEGQAAADKVKVNNAVSGNTTSTERLGG